MRRQKSRYCYGLIILFLAAFDRITKWFALNYLEYGYPVTSFFSFDLVMNRGISWSFFHSTSNVVFTIITLCVAVIIGALLFHTIHRYKQGYPICGEVLTLTGAVSNLIDRIIYGGVIDFIVVSIGPWTWPVFNVADCCIVLGIGVMFFDLYKK